MKGLTLTQKFDAVLEVLYSISGRRPTIGRIKAFIRAKKKEIHWGEIADILSKMQRDQLVYQPVTDSSSKTPNEPIYLITFEGKMLWESKGLGAKLERERLRWYQKHPVLYALTSAIGGAILSIGVGLILWQVDKQSKTQETQGIKQIATDANRKIDSLIMTLNNTNKK